MPTVGIFGSPDDAEVSALVRRIGARGAEPWVIDLASFPRSLRVVWREGRVLVDGRDTREMGSAYLRTVGRNLPSRARYGELRPAVPAEAWRSLYGPTLALLRQERVNQALRNTIIQDVARRSPVINPPIPQNLHRQKPLLFSRLVRAGVPVPPFLCTSEPESADAFAEHGWRSWSGVVDKPSAGIYKTTLWGEGSAKRHRWSTRPALLQRYIAGDTVRCYVLRYQVVAAARIVHGGTVDSSMSQTGIASVELTAEQRSIAERAARALDLAFCGMDLMVEAGRNETWVIDCNLSPMFVNFAKLSLVDVPGLLADALIEMAGEKAGGRPALFDMVEEAKRLLASDPRLRDRRGGRSPRGGDKP